MATPQVIAEIRTESGDSLYDDTNDALIVGGVAAHDAAAAGNPVLIGAEADETSADNVDEGDVGKLRMTLARLLKVESTQGEAKLLVSDVDQGDIDKILTVPAGKVWHISGMMVRFESSATSGARILLAQFRTAAGLAIMSWQPGLSTPQPASKKYEYNFMPGAGHLSTAVHGGHTPDLDNVDIPMPSPFVMGAGYNMRFRELDSVDASNDDMLIHIFGMEASI